MATSALTSSQEAWALRVRGTDAEALAGLRLEPGIEAVLTQDHAWLRGNGCTPELAHRLLLLPGAERFSVGPHGEAIPWGRHLPVTHLPETGWKPLVQIVKPSLPAPGMPAAIPERVALRLGRCTAEMRCTALLSSWSDWIGWVEDAPAHRLARLHFARCEDLVLVLGEPLPPLPGMRYWHHGQALLPAGWAITPADEPDLIVQVLGLGAGDLALFAEDGSWDLMSGDVLLLAARANVRVSGDPVHG